LPENRAHPHQHDAAALPKVHGAKKHKTPDAVKQVLRAPRQ
jgi:hypothetical protein